MGIKDLWAKTSMWMHRGNLPAKTDYSEDIDEPGLLNGQDDTAGAEVQGKAGQQVNNPVVVKKSNTIDKSEPIEKLQQGFNKLIEQLQGINEQLDKQATQNEKLMSRIEQLPELLEHFPAVVDNQKVLTDKLFEQLKTNAAKEQQFFETIEKIPEETAKQTDSLVNINHQLAASADTDVQMAEGFKKFNETLDKLNESTAGHTDGIMQMSKTFATSDRYTKYIMSRQNKRFMWLFVISLGVCLFAIIILTVIILFLKQ